MLLKRHLDLYTIGSPLELKSRFWSWYMRALEGTHLLLLDCDKIEEPGELPKSIIAPIVIYLKVSFDK
ncbi:unnamed protein product, partial [Darwinula stevensoni]